MLGFNLNTDPFIYRIRKNLYDITKGAARTDISVQLYYWRNSETLNKRFVSFDNV